MAGDVSRNRPRSRPHVQGKFQDIQRSIAEWVESVPADELVPYYKIWSRYPVLDAVYFARQIVTTLNELDHLSGLHTVNHFFFDHGIPESDQTVPAHFALSNDYFDRHSSLFRVYRDDEPSLYAVDTGLRIITLPTGATVTNIHEDIVAHCVQFVSQIAPRGSWGFPIRMHEAPSIFGTLAALTVIRSTLVGHSKLEMPEELSRHLENVAPGILSTEVSFKSSDMFAFKEATSTRVYLPTTEQAYQILSILRSLSIDTGKLDLILSKESGRALHFVRSCWDSKSGGFRGSPEMDSTPTICHTRYALQLLRTLLSRGDLHSRELQWLDINRVLEFANLCFVQPAFADRPEGWPTLWSMRNGVNVLKLVELLLLNGVVNPSVRSNRVLQSLLTQTLANGRSFVEECTDRDEGLCYAYPVRVLKEWARTGLEAKETRSIQTRVVPEKEWQSLLEAVTGIPTGPSGADAYEKAIEQLLSSLFWPALIAPQLQTKMNEGRKRVDITYLNAATEGFFHWIRENYYMAPFILIECKNYTSDPANPELDQLVGRFSDRRGKVGLLICRKLKNKELFMQRCRDVANQGHGYIIPLDDEDLNALVEEIEGHPGSPAFPRILVDKFRQLVM